MDLTLITQILWRRKLIIIVILPIVIILPYLFSQTVAETVSTRSRLRVITPSNGIRISETYAERLNNTLGYVLNSNRISKQIMESLGLEGDMPRVRVHAVPRTEVLELIIEDENPDIVNALSDLLSDNELEIYYGAQRAQSENLLESLALSQKEFRQLVSDDERLYGTASENILQILEKSSTDFVLNTFEDRQFQLNNLPLNFQAEVRTTASILDNLETGYTNAILLERSINESISILEYASEPNRRSSNHTLLTLAAGVIAGLALVSGSALIWENIDNKLHTVDSIQRITNLSPIGSVNKSRKLRQIGKLVKHNQRINQHEGFRKLRTMLQLDKKKKDEDSQVVLITSSGSQEGKSIIAANLAWVVSKNQRVLLIDANLRSPTQHKIFDIEKEFGLTDFLQVNNDVREYSVKHLSNRDLSIMTAGTPTDLIDNRRLDDLFKILRQAYDVIIVDTPHVGSVADILELTEFADQLILVATLGKTKGSNLYKTLDLINRMHIQDPMLVINHAPIAVQDWYYR